MAIGSGGLTGKGLFNGSQVQLNFLPEHHTDFIYAVIGEELGFIGAVLVILLYGILLIRAVIISFNASDLFGSFDVQWELMLEIGFNWVTAIVGAIFLVLAFFVQRHNYKGIELIDRRVGHR